MDKLPQVEKCCCGVALRTGTLAIGYTQLVFVVIALVFFSVNTGASFAGPGDVGFQAMNITLVVFFAIHIITSILLVVGTHKDRYGFIYTWVIFNAICIVIGIILYILTAVYSGSLSGAISNIISGLINTALSIYFIIVVNSHYNYVKGNVSQPVPQA